MEGEGEYCMVCAVDFTMKASSLPPSPPETESDIEMNMRGRTDTKAMKSSPFV